MPVPDFFAEAQRFIEQGGSPEVVEAVRAVIADPGTPPHVRAQLEASLQRYLRRVAARSPGQRSD